MTSDNFTVTRLCLALSVIFSHSFAVVGLDEPVLFGRSLGNFAVHCFFTISGYLIAGSFLSTTPGSFVFRRAIRIVPGYVAGFYLGTVAFRFFGGYSDNPYPGLSNGPLWTVHWEVVMYTGLLLIGLLGLLKAEVVGTLLLVGLLLVCIHLRDGNNGIDVIAPLAILFFGGAFIKLQEAKLSRFLYPAAFVALIFLFAPFVSPFIMDAGRGMNFAFSWDAPPEVLRYYFYLLALPFAMIYVCRYFPVSWRWKSDYSYGAYVYAWPIQQMSVSIFMQQGWSLRSWAIFLCSTAITLPLAAASWHFLESPALRLKSLTTGAAPSKTAEMRPHLDRTQQDDGAVTSEASPVDLSANTKGCG